MSEKIDLKQKNWKENIATYITFNGLPLFKLPYKTNDDSYILISSFLHTIDILAEETRKKIGRSADFYGFDLIDSIQVEVMEIISEKLKSKNKIRLFLQTPYGKTPINRAPLIALFGATMQIIPKINNNEINVFRKDETNEYFIEKLKESGYTLDKMMSELEHLKTSQDHFINYIPISLYSIEKEDKDGEANKLYEVGNYNKGNYKQNPVKTEAGKLTFDSGLIIGLAEALRSYQSAVNIETESIILRFSDYSIVFYYKKDDLPVISVFIAGKGDIEEMKKYHNDLRNLL
ncbi:MAG: hypothetical protein ACFFAO_14015 [Candidatus Hermodarchaeota archaeon]